MRRQPSLRKVALALALLLLATAVLGPAVFGVAGARIDIDLANGAPSAHHWLGYDPLGRDLLARTLAATPLSLGLALLAALIGAGVGIPLGAAGTVLGPRGRRFAASAVQAALTFPSMLIALFVVTLTGPGASGAAVAIGVALAPGFARTAQALATSVMSADYIQAARLLGVRPANLLWRYVLPNIADTLIIRLSTAAGGALVLIAGFSFLGFGVQPPDYDWGRMLGQGLRSLYVSPLPALAPGLAITLAGLAFNLLGDTLALGDREGAVDASPANRTTGAAGGPLRLVGDAVLEIEGLDIRFGQAPAVAGATLWIGPGEIVGLVGESGSGKTTLALTAAGLAPEGATVAAKRLRLLGADLLTAPRAVLDPLLGGGVAVVFQDALSALNPALRIGPQLAEKLQVYGGRTRADATARAVDALTEVGVPAAARRAAQFPHEFSGGMLQRAMIAMGLMSSPALLVADEPTTALDVTVQAQVLDVLRAVNARHGTAILFVSHDLAVVSQLCSRVVVMHRGEIVETLAADLLLGGARHPYTRELVRCCAGLELAPVPPGGPDAP